MLLVQRVVARFVHGSEHDPEELLPKFEHMVELFLKGRDAHKDTIQEAEELLRDDPTLINTYYEALPVIRKAISAYKSAIYSLSKGPANQWPLLQHHGYRLFLGLLRTRLLPDALRKRVEATARYYNRSRVNTLPKGREVEGYNEMAEELTEHLALAKKCLQEPLRSESGGVDRIKAGPFEVVNTGGFSDEDMKAAAEVVEEAAKLLRTKGLGKVCYGEALVSNNLAKATTLAFYMPNSDQFFVRTNLRGEKKAAVDTVIHELGHRLQYKFLGSKTREINRIYRTIKDKVRGDLSDRSLWPKPGEIHEANGRVYEVTGVSYSRTSLSVELFRQDDPKYKVKLPLVIWLRQKGKIPMGMDFVTGYAATDPDENFAEMISFYCLGKLPADQVAMLEAVLA